MSTFYFQNIQAVELCDLPCRSWRMHVWHCHSWSFPFEQLTWTGKKGTSADTKLAKPEWLWISPDFRNLNGPWHRNTSAWFQGWGSQICTVLPFASKPFWWQIWSALYTTCGHPATVALPQCSQIFLAKKDADSQIWHKSRVLNRSVLKQGYSATPRTVLSRGK